MLAGVGRHRAARARGRGGAPGGRPCRSRASRSGVASGVVEAAYFILLSAAYRRGDLSVVYPVARGTAPLLAVADRRRSCSASGSACAGSIGVVLLLAGFLVLQRPWRAIALARRRRAPRARRRPRDSAILFALATGVMIATYSAIDRVGTRPDRSVRRTPRSCGRRASVVLVAVGRARGRRRPAALTARDGSRRAAVGGWLTLAAYLCILVALSVAPLSRRRAAARIGDGLRGGLGLGPAGRGERPHRG